MRLAQLCSGSRRWRHSWLVLLPFSLALGTGLAGIDFGYHWDECNHINAVGDAFHGHTILPDWYTYPSLTYSLAYLTAVPYIVQHGLAGANTPAIAQFLSGSHAFKLSVRTVVLFVCCLSMFWIYAAVRLCHKSHWEALLAACLLGFSWEVAYHSRWIAPDALLMQFLALALVGLVQSCEWTLPQATRRRWLWLAAVAVGLAGGTKYNAVAFVPSLLVAGGFLWNPRDGRRRLATLALQVCLLVGVVFLLTTPGAILEHDRFYTDLTRQITHYGELGHGGYTVDLGFSHAWQILVYLTTQAFSPFHWPALLLFAFCPYGFYRIFRENDRLAIVLASVLALYLLMMTLQVALVVRNDLPMMPVLVLLCARGIAALVEGARGRGRALLVAGVVLACMTNAGWLIFAAYQTSLRHEPSRYVRQLDSYLRNHPHDRYFMSAEVRQILEQEGYAVRALPVTDSPGSADYIIFYGKQWFRDELRRPSNLPNFATTWFGPYEVNYNYYSSWAGDDRILVVPRTVAQELGLVENLVKLDEPGGKKGPVESCLYHRGGV